MNVSTGLKANTALDSTFRIVDEKITRRLWFQSIPPERVGINGEYDYHGLAKRVRRQLHSHADIPLHQIKVRQRGRVIILTGSLSCQYLAKTITKLILAVDGVDAVESRGLSIQSAS